jgi:5'-methylthioadenosine phosphorylase
MNNIRIGLIGGSGLGAAITQETNAAVINIIDTPFGPPASPILETVWHGLPVFILSRHGPGHTLNPSQVPYRANIFALKKLGVTHIIASGAVGSLREEYKPRDVVIPDQIIDKTRRAATFYERAAVHVEFAEPFCPVLRQILQQASVNGIKNTTDGTTPGHTQSNTHIGGCYVAMEGPAFSTRAESLMHRLMGGDLIGMTAMPEAKLAKEAEIAYALVALVTDYDCWKHAPASTQTNKSDTTKPDPFVLLTEIIGHLKHATDNAIALIKRSVEHIAANPSALDECPAHHALKLAIWSDKSAIDPHEISRLAPLWLKYFQ